MESEIRAILRDLVNHFVYGSVRSPRNSYYSKYIIKLLTKLYEFNNFHELITENQTNESFLAAVIEKTVSEKEISWGRIATLLAYVVKMYETIEDEKERKIYLDRASVILCENVGTWITNQGGWIDFVLKSDIDLLVFDTLRVASITCCITTALLYFCL
jgi:hypothetical protein